MSQFFQDKRKKGLYLIVYFLVIFFILGSILGIHFKILSSTVIFLFIFLGSLFGKGNGTTLAVILFFMLGLFVARKTKKYFSNSKLSYYF